MDSSVTKSDIDPDEFLSETFQLRNELSDLGRMVSDGRLTTIIIDALPEKMYSTVKMQLRDPKLGLEKIISLTKTIIINYSERSSVSKRSQESYRKIRNSGREPRRDNVRESAMNLTCHNCKKQRHEMNEQGVDGKVG